MLITLGVEDALSEAVAVKLVELYAEEARISRTVRLEYFDKWTLGARASRPQCPKGG